MNDRQKKKRKKMEAFKYAPHIKSKTIKKNQYLIHRYPFLKPFVMDNEYYFYDYTYMDDLEEGWRRRFGYSFFEDLKRAIEESGIGINDIEILQIKEKFGELRCYLSDETKEISAVIDKYAELSTHTCVSCGHESGMTNINSWLCPICQECYEKSRYYERNKVPYQSVLCQ